MNSQTAAIRRPCLNHRGLACRTCYAPHYDAGLHLVGYSTRSLELIAARGGRDAAKARELITQRKDRTP